MYGKSGFLITDYRDKLVNGDNRVICKHTINKKEFIRLNKAYFNFLNPLHLLC